MIILKHLSLFDSLLCVNTGNIHSKSNNVVVICRLEFIIYVCYTATLIRKIKDKIFYLIRKERKINSL